MPYVVERQTRSTCPCGSRDIDMFYKEVGKDAILVCYGCRRIACISTEPGLSGEVRRIEEEEGRPCNS